ncbi:uncharacterized protein EV154DRAFT_109185 [Mucor mucedo]|uniref:uncharacterized protein n=1 Tax=Mucor mucedo TaxID=29922 RepID=UPI00221F0934|nr:uncharacterized protein EV154DRAFT_109185 [Mucor mucedo]KAI7894198.1 hypothetical protein EV154DRAFT_109185 [Mucor mucedo]
MRVIWSLPLVAVPRCHAECVWELKTPARLDNSDYRCDPRSENVVADMYARYLASGDYKTLLVNVDTGYRPVGGQALVDLQSFDTMLDCPIELLHTIMLGVGKALVKTLLQDHLNPAEKNILETRLHETLSSSESCLRYYVVNPLLQACNRYLKDLGHNVNFYPGEVELKAMTVQLQNPGITDKRFRYNADGTILCNSSMYGEYGRCGK